MPELQKHIDLTNIANKLTLTELRVNKLLRHTVSESKHYNDHCGNRWERDPWPATLSLNWTCFAFINALIDCFSFPFVCMQSLVRANTFHTGYKLHFDL